MPFTEPPFTRSMTYDSIKELADFNGNLEDEIKDVPCHIQATERHIKIVTAASSAFTTRERREAAIAMTLESRKNRPTFESKKDFN